VKLCHDVGRVDVIDIKDNRLTATSNHRETGGSKAWFWLSASPSCDLIGLVHCSHTASHRRLRIVRHVYIVWICALFL